MRDRLSILDNENLLPEVLYNHENVSVIEFSSNGRNGFLLDYDGE